MALFQLDEPFFSTDGASHKRFTNMNLPNTAAQGRGP